MSHLSSGIGSGARLPPVSDEDFVDVSGIEARLLQGRARGNCAKLGRVKIAERSAVLANRGSPGTQDDNVAAVRTAHKHSILVERRLRFLGRLSADKVISS